MKTTEQREYAASMDNLHFSERDKDRLTQTLLAKASEQENGGKTMTGKHIRRVLASVAAAVLLLGTVSAAAAYVSRWSRSFDQGLQSSEELREQADVSGLAVNPGGELASATANGVTITAEQTIVDRYFALISFRIEGYSIPEGVEPDIYGLRVTMDFENSSNSYSGSFYDGIVTGTDGRSVYDNGHPLAMHPDGSWEKHYYDEDGSLTYELSMVSTKEEVFFGKAIEVSFESLGYGDKGEYTPVIAGPWELRWTLSGANAAKKVTLDREIGDSGVMLKEAEISPISLHLVYQTDGIWTGYETLETFEPRFMGVRLKDGTSYPFLASGPGSEGYTDMEKCLYETRVAINRLIDPEQVKALLFLNLDSIPAGVTSLLNITEENLYAVELN